jgi:hypothetical protein
MGWQQKQRRAKKLNRHKVNKAHQAQQFAIANVLKAIEDHNRAKAVVEELLRNGTEIKGKD